MKAFVAVTDADWYRYLAALPDVDEVNFWQPSGRGAFRALDPGDLLLFKLHYPEHFIVGGGFFVDYSLLPLSLAWDAFGDRNGVSTLDDMRRRIERYRRVRDPHEDYQIGCIILERPFYLAHEQWITPPSSFQRSIVRGKTYDLASDLEGRSLWREVELRLMEARPRELEEIAAIGALAMVRRRLGQGAFRVLVTEKYERRCAVTNERILPVLEAAHIRPVAAGGSHRIDNGVLLRSDFHTLFDRGYITVKPDLTIAVSERLRTDFENGAYYREYAGQQIRVPGLIEDRPNAEFLEWHGDTVFRADVSAG